MRPWNISNLWKIRAQVTNSYAASDKAKPFAASFIAKKAISYVVLRII